MKPLTLAEAAEFLRMSRSSLYQRKDIPRYRRPGSRVILFDQDELETWLKQGRIDASDGLIDMPAEPTGHQVAAEANVRTVAISAPHVYHRRAQYR